MTGLLFLGKGVVVDVAVGSWGSEVWRSVERTKMSIEVPSKNIVICSLFEMVEPPMARAALFPHFPIDWVSEVKFWPPCSHWLRIKGSRLKDSNISFAHPLINVLARNWMVAWKNFITCLDFEFKRWSFAEIHERRLVPKWFVRNNIPINVLFGNPRTVINLHASNLSLPLAMSNTRINDDSQEKEELNSKIPPHGPLLMFLSGSPLLFWGLGWWKGLYYHPEGIHGFILASCAVILGIILCASGVDGMLDWSLRF